MHYRPGSENQLEKWHKGPRERGLMPYNKDMEKTPTLTRNQIRLLDGLCDRWTFDQQVELAYEIWPDNYSYVRKCFSRLHNLGLIDWIPQEETSFGHRWWVNEKGVRFVIDNR